MDTQGLLLVVAVHAANLRDGARLRLRLPRLQHLWADAGYTGPKLETWIRETTDWPLAIVRRVEPGAGFQVLPRCWVVERTFAWLRRYRCLSNGYEVLPETTEAWIRPAMTGLMLRRLARTPSFNSLLGDYVPHGL